MVVYIKLMCVLYLFMMMRVAVRFQLFFTAMFMLMVRAMRMQVAMLNGLMNMLELGLVAPGPYSSSQACKNNYRGTHVRSGLFNSERCAKLPGNRVSNQPASV